MARSRAKPHPARAALRTSWPAWRSRASVIALLLLGGVGWGSLARATYVSREEEPQWRALAIDPLAKGGRTGRRMVATDNVRAGVFVPRRVRAMTGSVARSQPSAQSSGPSRIRGRAGDGLYWSLRAAGASPQLAAAYLTAIATQIDVGDVGPGDSFDMVVGAGGELLYAGLRRMEAPSVQLIRWQDRGQSEWIDAQNISRARGVENALAMPAQGPITSYFGYRYHPILHFTRFHAGIDIGASWGSPIVAAADGRVTAAGWGGGFGREVQIAHSGGITSVYGHMSSIVAQPGTFVRGGQLIGYVGSSGLSTGPHLHFEVRHDGTPVNPLAIRISSSTAVDAKLATALRTRLNALLNVGTKAL